MYNNKRAMEKYKQQSILTASPEELTLMLYNGCLKYILLGKEFIVQKNIPKANENIMKAQKIISHLQTTLNMDFAIAKDFDSMYEFMLQLLVKANIKKDTEKLEQAYELVEDFRDTWHQAMKKAVTERIQSAI